MADADVLSVVDKMIKQRKDSITQFEAGKREDLAAAERAEIVVLQGYLPAQASEAEVDAMIAEAIAATGAAGPAGIGKVMAVVKPKLAGRADIGAVSAEGQGPPCLTSGARVGALLAGLAERNPPPIMKSFPAV
jgi:uncharacterized protein YqeY